MGVRSTLVSETFCQEQRSVVVPSVKCLYLKIEHDGSLSVWLLAFRGFSDINDGEARTPFGRVRKPTVT